MNKAQSPPSRHSGVGFCLRSKQNMSAEGYAVRLLRERVPVGGSVHAEF